MEYCDSFSNSSSVIFLLEMVVYAERSPEAISSTIYRPLYLHNGKTGMAALSINSHWLATMRKVEQISSFSIPRPRPLRYEVGQTGYQLIIFSNIVDDAVLPLLPGRFTCYWPLFEYIGPIPQR
jgi:hypothetical protein